MLRKEEIRQSAQLLRKSSADRFIPNRATTNIEISKFHLQNRNVDICENKSSCRLLQAVEDFKNKKKYKSLLWSTFFSVPENTRILNFHSPSNKNKSSKTLKQLPWPVKPRMKPILATSRPSTVLDLPDIASSTEGSVIDWSCTGYIAKIFCDEVLLCHPKKNINQVITRTRRSVRFCLKWNVDGKLLSIALVNSKLIVWSIQTYKVASHAFCCCYNCMITSMEWSRTNMLLTGCSSGRICVWTHDLKCVKTFYNAHGSEIINLHLSCKDNYLASVGDYGTVRIWQWPTLDPVFEIGSSMPVKQNLSWHPWKESLVALGSSSLSIWNVASRKNVFQDNLPPEFHINAITFNPVTGELTVSYSHKSVTGIDYKVAILSDPNTVTDMITSHSHKIIYLLWAYGGKQLATVSYDESLCIWDFMENSNNNDEKSKRPLNAIPKPTSMLFGNIIR